MVAFFGLYVLQGVEPTKKSVHYKRKAGDRTPVSVANECPCGGAKRSQILPPQPIKQKSHLYGGFFGLYVLQGGLIVKVGGRVKKL